MKKYLKIQIIILIIELFLPIMYGVNAENIAVNFSRNKWDRSEWYDIKSPRLKSYKKMIQMSDHIMNPAPANWNDHDIQYKYGDAVYAGILRKQALTGNIVIKTLMSYDYRMAPLIVIAAKPFVHRDNIAELREHLEIVLFDEGINVWQHNYSKGKASWYKVAHFYFRTIPQKCYELKVEIESQKAGKYIKIFCDGHEFGYHDNNIPNKYYLGIIGCEGRNRFYSFKVTTKHPKYKKAIIQKRSGINNTMYRIIKGKKATVAFIGGSITEMKTGYVTRLEKYLQSTFPKCDFTIVNAGVSSTCSDMGAFRLARDVFKKAKRIDLLMVEFAVNDNQDGHFSPTHAIRGMEGIVRQARRRNPAMDIVFLYTANKSHIKNYAAGKVPQEIAAHEKVAAHYRIPSVNLAHLVSTAMTKQVFDWKKFGGVHPAAFGNQLYAKTILSLFIQQVVPEKISKYSLPENKCDEFSFDSGRLVNVNKAQCDKHWAVILPDWKKLPGAKRRHFDKDPVLYSNVPGSVFTLDFTGSAIGLLLTAGPDAGRIKYRIDQLPWREAELFTPNSPFLHYPYTLILNSELTPGKHVLQVKVDSEKHEKSIGHAVRIAAFAVN